MAKGLDGEGLEYLWTKIKSFVSNSCSNAISNAISSAKSYTDTKFNSISTSKDVIRLSPTANTTSRTSAGTNFRPSLSSAGLHSVVKTDNGSMKYYTLGVIRILKSGYYKISGGYTITATGAAANNKQLLISIDTTYTSTASVCLWSGGRINTYESVVLPSSVQYIEANSYVAVWFNDASGSVTYHEQSFLQVEEL